MKKLIVGIALGTVAFSTPVLAQMQGRGGGYGHHDETRQEAKQRADMIFQMIDVNHSGVVTRAEAEQALAQFQASRGGGGGAGHGGMMQHMLDQIFAIAPSITQQQFEAFMLARFDAEDLNHDGVVTEEERQQARALHGGAQGPGTPPAPPAGVVPPPNQ